MGKIIKAIGSFIKKIPHGLKTAVCAVGRFFGEFGKSFAKGDIFVKLSAIWMGAGYVRRKQYIKGLLMTLLQGGIIFYIIKVAVPYLSDFGTLGTVKRELVYDSELRKTVVNDYDNSFLILLFGLISIVVMAVALIIYVQNMKNVRKLQVQAESGKHVNTFREDVKMMMNDKFHTTLLSLPILGIVVFTIIPILVMVLIAFTNYDQPHLVPEHLFTWVGWANFKTLLGGGSITSTFGYTFRKILVWTFIWAVLATFTTYIGGILLSLLINNKKTKAKKLWRTLFIIAIAVPQFVSLLVVRNFFADHGIINSLCSNIGLTAFLKNAGLITTNYIPFLSANGWAHVMIVLINIWVGVPYLMLIATGVLMNIPADLYESARIDGANNRQIFRKITMPYMLFVTGPYLITSFIGNINNFNVIYLLTQDVYSTLDQKLANSSGKEIDLLVTWLYRLTQDEYNYKMASVIGIMVFLVCAAFTLVAFNMTIKGDREEKFQ